MRGAARRSLAIAAATGALLITSIAAHAALRPGRLPLGDGTPKSYTPVLAEAEFECGTYGANHNEMLQQRALHLRNQKAIQQGAKQKTVAALDYVYNDVWIIEDDGSLTLSGTNAFDTDLQTHQYANNGGGIYTVSSVTFSYDAVLGTAINPGDDGAVQVAMSFSFPFAGGNYNQVHISGNGAVAFGAAVNPNGYYDSADFFSATPKIAPYYMDLNVLSGGTIRYKSEVSKFTVTWSGVPEYGTGMINTAQLVLYPSGNFTITYNGIASITQTNTSPVITGFHPGGSPALEEIAYSADLPHVSAGGAAVYEQYYSFANPVVDEVALFNRFYQQFPDDFFQLVFFTNFVQSMAGFANELNIKNDVTGLGLGIFDGSSQYGSNGVLESRCNMNRLSVWNQDPAARVHGKGNNFLTIMGQEAGHRWGAFMFHIDPDTQAPSNLLLGRSDAHWSYYVDVDHSSLEGGNWQNTGGNNYVCPSQVDYFSEIDEYAFGLRTPDEVKDFFLIRSATNDLESNRSVGTPLLNAVATGTYQPITVEDIIAYEGARTPVEADENKDLRQGFILLVQQGTVPSQADLDKVAGFRSAWESYFERACDGRLTCNTSLTQTYQAGVIAGHVRDRLTQEIIPEFTARSIERSFNQHVPDGGRFFFRYLDGPAQGTSEPVTLIFEANGYYPDTLVTTATYGQTKNLHVTDVLLTPIYTGAGALKVPTELHANHPNPFNPSTTIRYTLGEAGRVRVSVYDAAGRHVRRLVDATEAAGEHTVAFDGKDDAGTALASGVYFYRLDTGNVTRTRKMVLLK